MVIFPRPLTAIARPLTVAAAFLIALALPAAGLAQERRVEGSLRADVMWTQLAGQTALLLGGRASLKAGSRLTLGGFGYGMARSVRVVEGAIPEDLRLGYGGLVVGWGLKSTPRLGLESSLLLGAGNAQIHARPIGNQLGSDNFLVVEPRLALIVPPGFRLRGELGAGYRLVSGVQDLPRLVASDLQGWTITLSLSLGGLK